MKKVLVTGAGGYIGRHVVRQLLEQGHQVIAVDLHTQQIDPAAQRVEMDIFSGKTGLYSVLSSPDVLIHMAWVDGFIHNSFRHLEYLPKHYAFLEDMIAGGLPHLSVMGTMHEVGYWEGKIDENTPCNPQSLYGIAKNALRQACKLLRTGRPSIIIQWLRAYYICGDERFGHSIFSKLAAAEREGKTTFPLNSGKNLYDFIQVEELARQIAAASTQSQIQGIINCCTGQPVSLRDKVEQFIAENRFSIRPDYGAFPDRPYDSPGVWGDAGRIAEIMRNGEQKII